MKNLDKILDERSKRYGDFQSLSEISQSIKEMWYLNQNFNFKEPTSAMNEAMEMVIHKLARCINGDRYYLDNIDDMINYLRLYKEEVKKAKSEEIVEDIVKELRDNFNFK